MHLSLDDLAPSGPDVGETRPITAEDLPKLRGPKGSSTPPRKKLRYKHHSLARALASGMQERAAAAVTGFAPVTVSILKKDPAFAELVKFYATEEGKGFDQVRAQLLGVGQRFVEEMDRRVREAPDELTMRDLRESSTVLLDRAGFGAAQSSVHDIHIHAGLASALQASRVNAPFPVQLQPPTPPTVGPPEGGVPDLSAHTTEGGLTVAPSGPNGINDGEFEDITPRAEGAGRKSFGWDE
jgi:hypothetical protein